MDAQEQLEVWLAKQPNIVGYTKLSDSENEVIESGISETDREQIEAKISEFFGSKQQVRWVLSEPPTAY